jgi:Tfp pilus assembly protein PilF
MSRLAACLLLVATALLGSACVTTTGTGLTDVMQRPAERALLTGLRAYEDGQYPDAERELKKALDTGLASAKDRAVANKHLAFVYCTSNRVPACDQAFRAALEADPEFTLSKAEAGHPLWGPVYRRVTAGR